MSQLSLKAQITEDMKAAMRAKETDRLGTIRLLQAAIKQREVDERIELDDAAVLAVIDKMLKQRKDSITAFEQAGRDDLVAKEAAEVAVLQVYMPAQLSEAEVDAAVRDAVAKVGASGPQDMGKVMCILKPALAGRADMTQVSARVKAALAGA
ncbi:MAG: GatB/YqeY domain-containing protein [Ralstonia sp.]|nr:GatB/YqeY domain-containing protein [Ralstonia sp.]